MSEAEGSLVELGLAFIMSVSLLDGRLSILVVIFIEEDWIIQLYFFLNWQLVFMKVEFWMVRLGGGISAAMGGADSMEIGGAGVVCFVLVHFGIKLL